MILIVRRSLIPCLVALSVVSAALPALARPKYYHHVYPSAHKTREDGSEYWVNYSEWTRIDNPSPTSAVGAVSPDSDWNLTYPADSAGVMVQYQLMDNSMMVLDERDITDMVSSSHHIHLSETGIPASMTVTVDSSFFGGDGFSIGNVDPIVADVVLQDITPDPDSIYSIARYLGNVTSPEVLHVFDPLIGTALDFDPDPGQHGTFEIGILVALPEPGSLLLLVCGGATVWCAAGRRRRCSASARPNRRTAPRCAWTILFVLLAFSAMTATAMAVQTGGTHSHKTTHKKTAGVGESWASLDEWLSDGKKPSSPGSAVTIVSEGPTLDDLMFSYSLMDVDMNVLSSHDQTDITRRTFTYSLSAVGTPPTTTITITEDTIEGPGLFEVSLPNPVVIDLTLDSIGPGPVPGSIVATYLGTVPAGEEILIRDPDAGIPDPQQFLTDQPYEFELILTVPEPSTALLAILGSTATFVGLTSRRRTRRARRVGF